MLFHGPLSFYFINISSTFLRIECLYWKEILILIKILTRFCFDESQLSSKHKIEKYNIALYLQFFLCTKTKPYLLFLQRCCRKLWVPTKPHLNREVWLRVKQLYDISVGYRCESVDLVKLPIFLTSSFQKKV